MKIKVFFGDMRLEKYTYDDRKGGQVPCAAHALCASVRSSQNPIETRVFSMESEATTGTPKMLAFLGKKMAAQNVNFVAYGQVGFPRRLLLVANEAVPL